MANTGADEGRNRPSNDPLNKTSEGSLRGKDASERAANQADAEDAPLTSGDTSGQNPPIKTSPAVMPAGAAANLSGDSSSGTAGGATGPQGTPAAAAILAGEIAFSQDDVKTGWDVLGADNSAIGTVAEVGPERILVRRSDREGMIYIPYSGVARVDKSKVTLAIPSGLVDQQDWQQVRPGGSTSGTSPPSRPGDRLEPSAQRGSGPAHPASLASSHAVETGHVEHAEHAGPVTTGRGVEEGPTHQTIRAEELATPPTPTPSSEEWRRPNEGSTPRQREEGLGSMRRAQDMMNNLRGTVQEGAQGQMSQNAPKEAFADMFSFLENIPNSFYYLATVISVMTSLVLFVTGRRWESLFVGLWAPTIVSASMFYKLLRPSHEVRRM